MISDIKLKHIVSAYIVFRSISYCAAWVKLAAANRIVGLQQCRFSKFAV